MMTSSSTTWLERQADELSQVLLFASSRCVSHVKTEIKQAEQLDPDVEWKLCSEFVFFFLHMCDRVAFQCLPAHDRATFMDELLRLTIRRFAEAISGAISAATGNSIDAHEFELEFFKTAQARQFEYGSYKLEVAEGEGFRDTLLWEFGKRMSQELGFQPLDALVNFKIITIVMDFWGTLDLPSRLTSRSQPK